MRTTIDIDDDVLQAARELAERQKRSMGSVISELSRQALTGAAERRPTSGKPLHGFRPFPRRGAVVTNRLIDQLRDEDAS